MFKTLIASTFLTAAVAFPVMAAGAGAAGTTTNDNGAATGTMNNGTNAGTMNNGTTPMNNKAATPMNNTDAMPTNSVTGNNAQVDMYGRNMVVSNIMGASVTDAKGESIGEIGDIVLSGKGTVSNYVIDVGGFLGIGEKPVALTPQDVQITADASGNLKATTALTKDELNSRPEFQEPEVPAATGAAPAAPATTK